MLQVHYTTKLKRRSETIKALFAKNNQPDYFPDYFLDYFYQTLCSDYMN
jgi:hypothetical protein